MGRSISLWTIGPSTLAVLLCAIAQPPVPAVGETIQLAYKTGSVASRVFTPAKSKFGGKPFQIRGEQGTLQVGGQAALFGVRYSQATKAFYGALDTDGDGQLGPREYVKFDPTMSASYNIKLGEDDYAVRLANVRISQRGVGGPVTGITGGYVINSCYMGTYAGLGVRLFDDNLDGQFTQDGKDAIAVGRSMFAIPLGKTHQIGKSHYDLEVSADGKQVTLTPVSGLELGVVEVAFRRGMQCLALYSEDGDRSYDLAASAKTGIPAGSYRLTYGVLTAGKMSTVLKPTDKAPVYEIEAGKINTLRLGPPLMVGFHANFSNGMVTVSPNVQVFGSGGEEYSFDYSGGTGRPHVLMLEGKRQIMDKAMEYG